MVSLTRRVAGIRQPRGGLLSRHRFSERILRDDDYGINIPTDRTAHAQLKGIMVDYLVRVMLGTPKRDAFRVSIKGADLVSEGSIANDLLNKIDNDLLSDESILAAYGLSGYDVAYRRNRIYYRRVDLSHFSLDDINEVRSMVLRTISFFKNENQNILATGITFDGAYNEYVSSADADFISQNTLWDLKTSKDEPTSKDTLQLVGYYFLGMRSENKLFDSVDSLGIYNPRLNKVYTVMLSDIPYNIMFYAGRLLFDYDFLGFFSDDWFYNTFLDVKSDISLKDIHQMKNVYDITDFDVDVLPDGIHKITKDDYWTYTKDKYLMNKPPQYSRTKQIYFLKNKGYHMFISENHGGNYCIMNGGLLKKIDKSLDYYYNALPNYVSVLKQLFGSYFDFLIAISNEIHSIWNIADRSIFSSYDMFLYENVGRVHGSIVDINYFNHLSVDFFDGKITLYSAENMMERIVYPDMRSFLEMETPELIESYDAFLAKNDQSLLKLIDEKPMLYIDDGFSDDESEKPIQISDGQLDTITPIFQTGTDMYSMSGVLKKIQRVFTDNHVVIWVDVSGFDFSNSRDGRWDVDRLKKLE